jgi:hypothetical protein
MDPDDLWAPDAAWPSDPAATELLDESGYGIPAYQPYQEPEEDVQCPDQPVSTYGERLGASSSESIHSGPGSVIDFFRQIIHVDPTLNALISLRGMFPCTGHITREEKRRKDIMQAAFEAHRAEIFDRLQNPRLLNTVVAILLNGNNRTPDREMMQFHAARYFGQL